MAREIDAAALGGLHAVIGRHKPVNALPIGAPCPNCATPLQGPWCHACGQSSDDHHRSLLRLSREAVEGLFDLDGRLWRTLPDLCLRPARLTRAYLDGHRVSQVPPFRLFLVVVVLVFLVASIGPKDRTAIDLSPTGAGAHTDSGVKVDLGSADKEGVGKWLSTRLQAAGKNPQRFEASLTEWAQRMAILALPMSALLLGLMFFWRRGIYLDHLIFSMHSLSFQGLLLAIAMLLGRVSGWFELMLLASPVHLYVHLKGAYGLGVFGTLWRMLGLFVGSAIGFAFAFVDLILIGLYEIGS